MKLKLDRYNIDLQEQYKHMKKRTKNSHWKGKGRFWSRWNLWKQRQYLKQTWKIIKEIVPSTKSNFNNNFDNVGNTANEFNYHFANVGKNSFAKTQELLCGVNNYQVM